MSKNKGMLIIAFVIALAFSACRREESPLVGTWANDTGLVKQFHSDGNWEILVEGIPNVKGTYTVDGDTITRRMTHLHGGVFDNLESRWFSESELNSAINRNLTELFAFRMLFPFERQTEIYTFSISGDTVTFTYTGTDWDDYETFIQIFTRK